MATVARSPNPADARVPCPLCGGLVHPIAGRCKHCKQDLTQFRGTRPHAAVPLPALVAPPAPTPVPVAIVVTEASQPVLPPRVTAQSVAVADRRSAWRSWPSMVIALAIVAIVAAIAIMVWPDRSNDAKKALPPPPAPERMDTSPLPPHAQLTPVPPAAPPSQPDVWDPPQTQRDPDVLSQDPDDDLADPFATPHAGRRQPAPGSVTGVAECDDVVAVYRQFFRCDKLRAAGPAAMRAQRDALDAMMRGWGDLNNAPQAAKDAMAVACRQAVDGLRQGADAMGCPI